MIDDKTKEVYRQIKAPDHLKERVMQLQAEKSKIIAFPAKRIVKITASLAACFMIVAVIAVALLVGENGGAAIIVSGETVGESPVEVVVPLVMRNIPAPASMTETVSVEFSLDCKGECRVIVNCGEITDQKQTYSDGDIIVWNVTDIPEEGALLYLEYGNKTSTYTLTCISDKGVWTINKK